MENYRKIFIKNLNTYLNQHEMSQVDLANLLQINKSVVSSWLSGSRYPRMNTMEKIANIFHIEKSDLIEKKTAPPEHEINIEEAIKKAYGETTKDAVELFTQLDLLDQGQTIGTMKLLLDAPKYKKEKSGA
jgi:hypothetical protein|nr:MAG TPA: Repressor protein CI [Caudoviricetes sp.]